MRLPIVRRLLPALVVVAAMVSAACGGGTGAAPAAKPAAQTGSAPASTTAPAAQQAPAGQAAAPSSQPAAQAASSCDRNRTYKFTQLNLGWSATEIVQQEKLLEKRGWKIEWAAVPQVSALVNTFASGQVDLINMSTVIVGQMYENNVKLKVFGTGVGVLGAVVVPTSSPARELPDLRGKKVALVPGATTAQDINASSRVVYNFDLLRDTEAIQSTAPPDVVNLLRKGDVDAGVTWEPTTSALIRTGDFRILAHQQDLWERASGSKETEIHVVYVAKPELAELCPELLADVNAAQREAYDIWHNQKDVAVKDIVEFNKLTPEEAEFAMSQTRQVLYGLSDANMDTILAQLKHNREHGTLLKSDVWNNPAQVKADLFFVPPPRS